MYACALTAGGRGIGTAARTGATGTAGATAASTSAIVRAGRITDAILTQAHRRQPQGRAACCQSVCRSSASSVEGEEGVADAERAQAGGERVEFRHALHGAEAHAVEVRPAFERRD